jgi:hypothetical protein
MKKIPKRRPDWAERRADAERAEGIPDRPALTDCRLPITLDLRSAGGQLLTLEPRLGYVAWRAVNEAGAVVHVAALKELLHRIADDLPRALGRAHWG